MRKYASYIIIVIAIVIGAVIIYWVSFMGDDVYSSLPSSTIAVFETRNWSKAGEQIGSTVTGNEWLKTSIGQKLSEQMEVMQKLVSADRALVNEITAKAVVSVHLVSADAYDLLFASELNGVNDNTLLNRIQSSPITRKVEVRIFKNQKIIDVTLKDGRQLTFAKNSNVFVFSFTSFIIENSIAAFLSGTNLQNDKGFKELLRKNSTADLLIYVNYNKVEVLLPVCIKANQLSTLHDVKNTGTWTRYELAFTNTQVEAYVEFSSSATDNTSATVSKPFGSLLAYIPDNAAYVHMNIVPKLNSNNLLSRYFGEWVGDVQALVIVEPLSEKYYEQNLLLISTNNSEMAKTRLNNLLAENGDPTTPIDLYNGHEIYFLSDASVLQQTFGNSFVSLTQAYVSIEEKTVLFAQSLNTLQLALEKISIKQTLNSNADFVNSGEGNINECQGLTYLNVARSSWLLKTLIKEGSTLASFLSSQKSVLQFARQEGNKNTARLFLKLSTGQVSVPGLLWKTKLRAPALSSPQSIFNSTSGETEIIVQDTLFNLYLLDQAGQILFEKNLSEPIRGKISTIDYYNNGARQFIVATSNHIYVIDKSGGDIGSFPMQLAAETKTGIVTYTDGTKQRYLVSCGSGSIYGYEINGKPLAGFSPLTGVGKIETPLQILNSSGKAYLLVESNTGNLMLFDMAGKQKWEVQNSTTSQPFTVLNDKLPVILNAIGNHLVEVSLDGNDKLSVLIDTADWFTVVTTDTSFNYCFSSRKQVRTYNAKHQFYGAVNLSYAPTFFKTINVQMRDYLMVGNNDIATLYSDQLKKIAEYEHSGCYFTFDKLQSSSNFVVFGCNKDGYITCQRLP